MSREFLRIDITLLLPTYMKLLVKITNAFKGENLSKSNIHYYGNFYMNNNEIKYKTQ